MSCLLDNQSVKSLCGELADKFRVAGIDEPELDARLLVQHVCCFDYSDFIKYADRCLTAGQTQELTAVGARRLNREPIARIIGEAEFWSLKFALSKETLVPRPDTETVVEEALRLLGGRRPDQLKFLDIGAGSGCILLSLLSECLSGFGVGLDRSEDALKTAQKNAHSLNLHDRTSFICGDWLEAVTGPFDVIVTNPPYIESDTLKTLAPEVSKFDPKLALDGGADGLDPYEIIFSAADKLLTSHGIFVCEFGAGQRSELMRIFERSPLSKKAGDVRIGYDLAQRERTLSVQLKV